MTTQTSTPEGKALNPLTKEPWADWEISMLIKHIEDPKNAPWLKGWSPLQQKLMLDGLKCLLRENLP